MERAFDRTAHKMLWNWLAENPGREKADWPGWKSNGGKYAVGIDSNQCFACDYVGPMNLCEECPLLWPGEYKSCCAPPSGGYGLYQKWDDETDMHRRSEFAEQIRDLPVGEGVRCK